MDCIVVLHLLLLHLPQTRKSSWPCSLRRVWFDSAGLFYILQKRYGNLPRSFAVIKNAPSEEHLCYQSTSMSSCHSWGPHGPRISARAARRASQTRAAAGGVYSATVYCCEPLEWKGTADKDAIKILPAKESYELLKSRSYYSFLNYSFQLPVAACAPLPQMLSNYPF